MTRPTASSLRNRARITNKSRLKIHVGSIDVDPIIPDEDEEKNRIQQSYAGVDKDDVNEEHLQAVLSEAARRNQRSSRTEKAQTAYIPIPDSTGIVADYEQLYPPKQWKEPQSYICTSETVEELCLNSLADGFNYYMDERDKEWLDRNNEEARGEGTSKQGSLSSTRSPTRRASSKGKDIDPHPVVITEDEFELVIGIFERGTTDILHKRLASGMSFPSFEEYQETFSNPLPHTMFTALAVPSWVPQASKMFAISQTVYPYWKERRVEREGRRIIPVVNLDESDNLNESYVCFRRRESKAIRKTRASQVSSSEKLAKLQSELDMPLQLAQQVLQREVLKQEYAISSRHLWLKRAEFADLRRKLPSLGIKTDEELLVDREKPKKESRSQGLRIHAKGDPSSQSTPMEAALRPRERFANFNHAIEAEIARYKERDRDFEDITDYSYIPPASSLSARTFKLISPPDSRAGSPSPEENRLVRTRIGRGGRLMLDRRSSLYRNGLVLKRRRVHSEESSDADEMDDKLRSRWRFDQDEVPRTDEQDRMLVDDQDPKYLRHLMYLVNDQDMLMTDPTIIKSDANGKKEAVVAFRLGVPPSVRQTQMQTQIMPRSKQPIASQQLASAMLHGQVPNGQLPKEHHTRISRPSSAVKVTSSDASPPLPSPARPQQQQQPQTSPIQASTPVPPQSSPSATVSHNPTSRGAITMPHVPVKSDSTITVQQIQNLRSVFAGESPAMDLARWPNNHKDRELVMKLISTSAVNGRYVLPNGQTQQPNSIT